MPELPEVEAVCRRLRDDVPAGQIIASAHVYRESAISPQKVADFECGVAGRRVEAIERRAKNIFLRLSGGLAVRVHLRMTGNLYAVPDVRFHPADTRVGFEFPNHRGILFTDRRALGRLQLHTTAEVEEILRQFGPEPLSPEFTGSSFLRIAKLSHQPAKLFLMDQARVAGLGNIYAAEALFHARVNPTRIISGLSRTRLLALHGAIVQVLNNAVQSAWKAYSGPGQFAEGETFPCFVYDKEGDSCQVCGRVILRIPQGGRSTYYCPGCQK